jgi:hypothetical protein
MRDRRAMARTAALLLLAPIVASAWSWRPKTDPSVDWLHALDAAATANADAAAALRAAALALAGDRRPLEPGVAAALRAAVEAAAFGRRPAEAARPAERNASAAGREGGGASPPSRLAPGIALVALAVALASCGTRLVGRLVPAARAHAAARAAATRRGGRPPPFPLAPRRVRACVEDIARASSYAVLAAAVAAAAARGGDARGAAPTPGQAFVLCLAGWAAAGWAATDAAGALARAWRQRRPGGPARPATPPIATRAAAALASPRGDRPALWPGWASPPSPATPRRRRRRHSVAGERAALAPAALAALPPRPPRPRADPATASLSCRLCWDAPRGVALLPCGHVGTCAPCALALLRSGRAACPFCAQAVTDVARVFIV